MIIRMHYYTIKCDNCGKLFEDGHKGYCDWNCKTGAWENASDSDWIKEDIDTHYCPDCYSYMATKMKATRPTNPAISGEPVLSVVDVNELKLFANWLWDMDMIQLNIQMPPFEDADKLALTYVKTRIEPRVLINEHFAKDEQIELKLLDLFGFSKDGGIMAAQQLKILEFMKWFRTNYR